MLQILSLYFALRYCFTRDEKKRTYFLETAMEVLETFFKRLDPH